MRQDRRSIQELKIEHDTITVFASGDSINDLTPEEIRDIKSKSFLITINYAPKKILGHMNIFSDQKVVLFLDELYSNKKKDILFLSRPQCFQNTLRKPKRLHDKVDYWFDNAKEKIMGNYTIVWLLQILLRHFPNKNINIFGLDMEIKEEKRAKWYDKYTDYDFNKRTRGHNKLKECDGQLHKFCRSPKIKNCNSNSKSKAFDFLEWKPLYKKMPVIKTELNFITDSTEVEIKDRIPHKRTKSKRDRPHLKRPTTVNPKETVNNFKDLKIEQKYVSVFASGLSIEEMSKEDIQHITKNTFTVTMNYGPVKIPTNLNAWTTRGISNWVYDHYKITNNEKNNTIKKNGTLFLAKNPGLAIDFSFEKERQQGTLHPDVGFTLAKVLSLFDINFPNKKVLIFGLDMDFKEQNHAKWYDSIISIDKKVRHGRDPNLRDPMHPINRCGKMLDNCIKNREMFFNCNPNSKYEGFQKTNWKGLLNEE